VTTFPTWEAFDEAYFSGLTPLNAPADYTMGWPARWCDWCEGRDLAWAVPAKGGFFPRRLHLHGEPTMIQHEPMVWFSCRRCAPFVRTGDWDGLAVALGHEYPPAWWRVWGTARLSEGYEWKWRTVARSA